MINPKSKRTLSEAKRIVVAHKSGRDKNAKSVDKKVLVEIIESILKNVEKLEKEVDSLTLELLEERL